MWCVVGAAASDSSHRTVVTPDVRARRCTKPARYKPKSAMVPAKQFQMF